MVINHRNTLCAHPQCLTHDQGYIINAADYDTEGTVEMPDKVILSKEGDIARIVLNRPDRENAVDAELMAQLTESLSEVVSDDGAVLLVLEGQGEHFCCGRESGLSESRSADQWADALGRIVGVNGLLQSFRGVSLAVVRGKAFGFGCGLAVQSDITLASDDARFAFPEIKSGFPPTIVMSYLSRWIHRKKAFELVIAGDELGAREAERHGLVNRVVAKDQLNAETDGWVARLRGLDRQGLQATKAFFRDTAEWTTKDAAQYGVVRLANFLSSRKEP